MPPTHLSRPQSATCQAIAWKDEHKKICQEIVVQKDLLQGWAHTWADLLKWVTVFALDFDNRPGNHRDRRYYLSCLAETGLFTDIRVIKFRDTTEEDRIRQP